MIDLTPLERSVILQIVHSTVSECTVLAFGSRISGKQHRASDLDLAIVGQKRFSVLQLFELKEKSPILNYHSVLIFSIGMPLPLHFKISSHLPM